MTAIYLLEDSKAISGSLFRGIFEKQAQLNNSSVMAGRQQQFIIKRNRVGIGFSAIASNYARITCF